MTMADGSYDPMGHIQTGRQHPHSHHPMHHHHSGAGGGGGGGGGGTFHTLEQLHQLHQRYQLQQQHLHHQHQQQQQQQQQPSPSSLENNNNLPSTANHNLFRSEQKKHKRKRLSAVLDKLHHNGSMVNHNNNNVGEVSYKIKRSESRSSTEESVEDVFPYSASPRISVSPLRLNESDENKIKQEPQQYLVKQLQYMNPLAFFNYLPHQTKLLYQEIARQRSHSDSDVQPQPLKKLPETIPAATPVAPPVIPPAEPEVPQELPLDLSMKAKPPHTRSPSLDTMIKQEPKLTFTPPPQQPLPSIVKGDVASGNTKKSAAACYNLNVSPVVEEMPPGSDVAYMCPVCGQLFSLQDRLAKHMASRHKSRSNSTDITKSYMCEVCNRSFARSDMLTRHMRLHTGVKPYSCKICGQIFSRSDHLSTHQRTHTGEKPYKCPQCPYAACRRDMITRHMRTHTRYDSQRGSGSASGSPSGSPSSMDQNSLMLPVVSLSSGATARAIKKESAFANSPGSYVIEAKTES
ncbi:early growth response protein 1 isoform X2 [Uranotaenia lowii]|nr:early growth response protein 1 isoform X2 [Uranotaenia lowii]